MATFVDQVVRRERFEQAHPNVTFTFDDEHKVHRAFVRHADDSVTEVADRELGYVIDRAEQIVTEGEQ
jgi:hypothetical protein